MQPIHIMTKICIYCKEEKVMSAFPKHSHYKDNHDSRCKVCVKSHSQLRNRLHKIAPLKPKVCECCGEIPRKWCLDHVHITHEIRGWLCDNCNTGIGKLGDQIEGIQKALNYLQKTTK